MYLSNNLRYLRSKSKLSQQRLANILDLSRSQIASYEAGIAEPNTKSLMNLSKFFGVLLHELIEMDLEKNAFENHSKWEHNKVMTLLYAPLSEEEFRCKTEDIKKATVGIRQLHQARIQDLKENSYDLQAFINECEYLLHMNDKLIQMNELLINQIQICPSKMCFVQSDREN